MLCVAFCLFKTLHNLHYEQIGKEVRCIEDELPFEIPDSWEWTRLNEIRIKEIKRGKSPKYATEGDVLVFAQKCNTKYNSIDISLSKHLDSSSLKKYDDNEKMVDGDIVINSTGTGTMGRIGYYSANCNPNNYILVPDSHVTIVRVSTILNSKFMKNAIDQYRDYFEKHGEGSTNQKELKPITIQNIFIPIPPQSEQNKIIKMIDKLEPLIEKYKHAEEQLYELNSNIKEQLKKSILQYAIAGKLVPQNPNDEPASVLLERIHKEKQKLIDKGEIKKDKNESMIYRRDNSYYEKCGKQDIEITDEITINIPSSWSISRLKDLVEISTGKKDANYGSETGKYDFFTCANTPIKADEYSYSGEYLIMPGNGANIGTVIYYNGKFEAYQRTYLLKNIYSINLKWMKYHLESNWKEYNSDKMYGSAIPYIKLSNLENYLVYIPPLAEQNKIIDFLNTTNAVLEKL